MTITETVSTVELAALVKVVRKTVWAWITSGVSVGGRVVKLKAARAGKRWRVTPAAWEEFQRDIGGSLDTPAETPAEREQRAERARARLRELGVAV